MTTKHPSKRGSKDGAVSWWNPTCSIFLSLFFLAHTGLISVGSTTPSVSLLGILIPLSSSLHSYRKAFLVIFGNFIFNQKALLGLKVNVIGVTKRFNTNSEQRGFCMLGMSAQKNMTAECALRDFLERNHVIFVFFFFCISGKEIHWSSDCPCYCFQESDDLCLWSW